MDARSEIRDFVVAYTAEPGSKSGGALRATRCRPDPYGHPSRGS